VSEAMVKRNITSVCHSDTDQRSKPTTWNPLA